MLTLQGRNVNDLLPAGIHLIQDLGQEITVRGQRTLEVPSPVCSVYHKPTERLLFSEVRDANPFFHLFESLWILAGRNDVEFLTRFNKRMTEFSDDGVVFNAAYGHRLRESFGFDQLVLLIALLKRDPNTRRAVLSIWNPIYDLEIESKDISCNTTVYFRIRNGKLDMTVCCRSNDVVWGAYGANAVQFSMLQEYIAASVNVSIGLYYQISNSFHAYIDRDDWKKITSTVHKTPDFYTIGVEPYQLVHEPVIFLTEVSRFLEKDQQDSVYSNTFLSEVARPMRNAWFRHQSTKDGWIELESCKAMDWRIACQKFLQRRGDFNPSASLVSPEEAAL